MQSKTTEFTPKKNLTTLKPSPEPKKLHVSVQIPFTHISSTCYPIESDPPVKSSKMFEIDHPPVDFLLKFKYT